MSAPSTSAAPAPVLVLGMHRSGTSCLAGCLEEAGLWLGEVNRAARFNAKGNRESREGMELNDAVLAAAGAAWDDPPASDPVWSAEHRDRLEALVAGYPADRVWGLKDPRVLLTLSGWHERLAPRCAGTFRHPLEVAASLRRRAKAWNSEMTQEHALYLWRTYNARMLDYHVHHPFPVLRYDQPAGTYRDRVRRIARTLALPAPDAIEFLDTGLRNETADAPVPASCADIWERLVALDAEGARASV
jgi:hypothetical protein